MTAAAPPPGWLTTIEVAARFRVSPAAVVRWLDAGTIPRGQWFRTPGPHGHYRIRAAWVDEYLNGDASASR